MPSFSVSNITPTAATINVIVDSAYPWYRVIVRPEPADGTYLEQGWYNATSNFYIDVTGMSPGSNYAVNVQYNTTGQGGGGNYVGTQYFTTKGLSSGGVVYINGTPYIPYVYVDGQWRQATGYIYADGWRATTEG